MRKRIKYLAFEILEFILSVFLHFFRILFKKKKNKLSRFLIYTKSPLNQIESVQHYYQILINFKHFIYSFHNNHLQTLFHPPLPIIIVLRWPKLKSSHNFYLIHLIKKTLQLGSYFY